VLAGGGAGIGRLPCITNNGEVSKFVFVPIQLEICIKHHGFGESMSVLVTGGAGYIGSHMIHELAEADEGIVLHVR
jgi:hypothetical protein